MRAWLVLALCIVAGLSSASAPAAPGATDNCCFRVTIHGDSRWEADYGELSDTSGIARGYYRLERHWQMRGIVGYRDGHLVKIAVKVWVTQNEETTLEYYDSSQHAYERNTCVRDKDGRSRFADPSYRYNTQRASLAILSTGFVIGPGRPFPDLKCRWTYHLHGTDGTGLDWEFHLPKGPPASYLQKAAGGSVWNGHFRRPPTEALKRHPFSPNGAPEPHTWVAGDVASVRFTHFPEAGLAKTKKRLDGLGCKVVANDIWSSCSDVNP